MADFDRAFEYLAPLEGGYVDDPDDRGGATKYGISLRFYKEKVDQYANEEDIQEMSLDEAAELYQEFFWNALGLALLDSQRVADRVFALAVHAGLRPAVRVLQKALVSAGGWDKLAVDGVLGPETLYAVNSNALDQTTLLRDLRLETLEFYRRILSQRPALEKFRRGWERRGVA